MLEKIMPEKSYVAASRLWFRDPNSTDAALKKGMFFEVDQPIKGVDKKYLSDLIQSGQVKLANQG